LAGPGWTPDFATVGRAFQLLCKSPCLAVNKSRGRTAAPFSRIGSSSVSVAVSVDPADDPVRERVVDEDAHGPKRPEERAVDTDEDGPAGEERSMDEKRPMRETREVPACVRCDEPAGEPRSSVPGGCLRRCRTKRKSGSESRPSDPAKQSCFLPHTCLQQSQLATRVPDGAISQEVQTICFQLFATATPRARRAVCHRRATN
jgi:hypothetical protein